MISFRSRTSFYVFLSALLVGHFYSVYVTSGIFNYTFVDYQVWFSVGRVLREYGFDRIYDLDLLRHQQQYLIKSTGYIPVVGQQNSYFVLPFVYPSIFAGLLYLVGNFSPIFESFLLCAMMGFIATYSLKYLVSFYPHRFKVITAVDYIAAALISTGNHFSLVFLNPSILLASACAIGISCIDRGYPICAGIIFSLCIAKPNIAIWIFLGLFLSREYKVGMIAIGSAFVLLILSVSLAGFEGTRQLSQILIHYRPEYGNWAESMPNIRMIFVNIASITENTFLGYIASTSVACIFLLLGVRAMIRHKWAPAICLLCCSLFATTLNVHSHIHTIALHVPFLFYYILKSEQSISWMLKFLYAPVVILLVADLLFLDLAITHRTASIAILIMNAVLLFLLGQSQTIRGQQFSS